jgi:hypothetical protein
MSKQTALEFFLMGLVDLEIGKGIPTDKEIQLHNLYAQAKAMEREQMVDFALNCQEMFKHQIEERYIETYK